MMSWIRNIGLLIITNILVIALISLITSVFGLGKYMSGSGLQLTSLLVYSFAFGFIGAFISLFISKWMAKTTFQIQLITTPTSHYEQLIYTVVKRISDSKGITMPEIGIYESPEINAFATGYSKNNSLVAVSTGLLNTMTDDEIEGVLGHEMTHILNGDMVTMTLLQGVMNTFVIFLARIIAFIIGRITSRDGEGNGLGQLSYIGIVMVLEIVLGIFAGMIVKGFSRWREYRADSGSSDMVGRDKMVAALRKLKSTFEPLDGNTPAYATMKIADKSSFSELFMTHPPLDKRINALLNIHS